MTEVDAVESLTSEALDVLRRMEDLPYGGESVSQRSHGLQTGWMLRREVADDEVILAGVLHDVGRALRSALPREPHEETGQRWCASRFGEKVGFLVGAHVAAKRVLVATEPDYASTLSAVSVATLRIQGGSATPDDVRAFFSSPWANEALALRRADDQAKSLGGEEISETDVVDLIISVASRRQHS